MPPKYKVSKDEILKAAWSLLEEKGLKAVTTRAIAEKLGVSSRPVYSFFPSMEKLFDDLIGLAVGVLQEYMRGTYTEDSFLNMGVGFVCLYREKPHVAEFLELKWSKMTYLDADKKMFNAFYETIMKEEDYKDIPRDDLYAIYTQLSIYTYGLVQFLKSSWLNLSVPEIINFLCEEGEARFVHYFWKKKGKPSL